MNSSVTGPGGRTSPPARLSVLRTPPRRLTFLFLFALCVFALPYDFPVIPAISLSYVVGFNNHAAVVFFSLGAALFALLTPGEIASPSSTDRTITRRTLFAAVTIIFAICMLRVLPFARHRIGIEADYGLNRLQMLVAGLRPYRDFEFAYGPAQLYLPLLFSRLFRVSAVAGYYIWWTFQWVGGVAMLWAIARLMPIPSPRRTLLFWGLLALQIGSIVAEGIAYTPVRTIGSAFVLLAVWMLWERSRAAYLTALAGIAAVLLVLAVSPDQATGVIAGLLGWFLLLTWRKEIPFPWPAAALFAVAALTAILIAIRLGVFATLASFARGIYSFPLLPSPSVLLILFAYIIAACVAVQALRQRHWESVTLPLALGGFAMLPAAFARCDLGHLQLAAPALLLGVFAIEARPVLRRWWSPLAVLFLVLPLALQPAFLLRSHFARLHHAAPAAALPTAAIPAPDQTTPASARVFARPAIVRQPPCPVLFRTLTLVPAYTHTAAQECLDTGYYMGRSQLFSTAAMQHKIDELSRRPPSPLLLLASSLEDQMPTVDTDPAMLRALELSPFVPKARNQPVDYSLILNYIRHKYTPDPDSTNGLRIWRPKP